MMPFYKEVLTLPVHNHVQFRIAWNSDPHGINCLLLCTFGRLLSCAMLHFLN